MEGLASHLLVALTRVVACNVIDTYEPFYKLCINILVLSVFLVAPAAAMADVAVWIFNKLTIRSNLPFKNAAMVMKLALSLGIFLRERTIESKMAKAFSACPLDVADFALELAVYMISLDLLLIIVVVISRLAGPKDQRAVAVAFVVILVLGLTWFNEVTQEWFRNLFAILRQCMAPAAGKLYGQDWTVHVIDFFRSHPKGLPRRAMR